MAYRVNGTDPFLRLSIGAFNGYNMEGNPYSWAALLKRNAASAWHGIYTLDNGAGAVYTYPGEFNPSNQLAGAGDGTTVSVQTFNDTTNWMIVGATWDGTSTTGHWIWRWKIGASAFGNEPDTAGSRTIATPTSAYRHIIGNEPGLGDDANFDLVCIGAIKSNLSQASFESLDMLSIATWDAVFAGAPAMLIGCDGIGSRTDRTGNGANEVSRSAGITLVSDPVGFSWGGAATKAPVLPPRGMHKTLLTH